jgi:hypothetical protein
MVERLDEELFEIAKVWAMNGLLSTAAAMTSDFRV